MRTAALLMALCLVASAHAASVEAVFSEGLQAYTAENYELALKRFEEAVRLEPNEARYHHWMGRAAGRRAERVNPLRAAGLARKVRSAFERAVELSPTSVEPLVDLFQFYLEAPGILGGGDDKARAVAERLAKLSPADGHHAQSELLVKRKDYAAAEQELRLALEAEPKNVERYADLAVFLTRRGRYDEAAALLDAAGAIESDSPQLLFARGKCLVIANKDPQRARQLLEEYLRRPRQPDDPAPSEVHDLLKKLPHKAGSAIASQQSSIVNRQLVDVS